MGGGDGRVKMKIACGAGKERRTGSFYCLNGFVFFSLSLLMISLFPVLFILVQLDVLMLQDMWSGLSMCSSMSLSICLPACLRALSRSGKYIR